MLIQIISSRSCVFEHNRMELSHQVTRRGAKTQHKDINTTFFERQILVFFGDNIPLPLTRRTSSMTTNAMSGSAIRLAARGENINGGGGTTCFRCCCHLSAEAAFSILALGWIADCDKTFEE